MMNNFVKTALLAGSIAVTAMTFSKSVVAKQLKIAFSIDDLRVERWTKDRDYFVKAAREEGAKVYVSSADASSARQISQVENFISRGVDAIVIVPFNGKVLKSVIASAKREGIKVIAYDRLILNSDIDAYITFDNVGVGEMQAKELIKVKPKGNYFLLGGSPTDNNAFLFRRGQENVLKPYIDRGDIKVVGRQWTKDWMPSEGLKIIENALTKNHNKIDAIVASNDGLAGAAIQALKAQGLTGVAVSGQDADLAGSMRVAKGEQTMTVYKPLKLLASSAAKLAIDLAKGKKVKYNTVYDNGLKKVKTIGLPITSITKKNIDILIKDKVYTKKQLGLE